VTLRKTAKTPGTTAATVGSGPVEPPQRLQPLVAIGALRRLVADPQRTEEVFVVVRALAGDSIDRGLRRFRQLPLGRRVLKRQEVLLDELLDRKRLADCPGNSLASAYLRFTAEGDLSADGLVDASEQEGGERFASAEHQLYGERLRDQHDLWHTLTGYGRDELGEVCLLAFTYAQTKNRGLGVICLVGMLKLFEHYGRGVFSAAWAAYRDGRRAEWLPGQDWSELLGMPLASVRDQLRVTEPGSYSIPAAFSAL